MKQLNFLSLTLLVALIGVGCKHKGPLGVTYGVIAVVEESRHTALQVWADEIVKQEAAADALPEPDRSVALRKIQAEIVEVNKHNATCLEAKALAQTYIDQFNPDTDNPQDLKQRVQALLNVTLNALTAAINRFK